MAGLIWPALGIDFEVSGRAIIKSGLKLFVGVFASPAFGRKQHTLLNGITAATRTPWLQTRQCPRRKPKGPR